MLRRTIERYLRASSEREYEIPFRQLLWAMGYELLESHTTHHPFEFGKDIRVLHPDKSPKVWLFQTKSGDISQSGWADMERQLKLLLVMHVEHPNILPDEPVQGVWVCTGDLSTTVAPIMTRFNEEYKKQNYLPVEVWNINKLVDLFVEHFFQVNICPDEIALDVINLLSGFQNSQFNLKLFDHILERLINEELDTVSERKVSRTLATAEIVTYYVLGRAYEVGDLYSAIDALQSATIHVWRFGKTHDFRYGADEVLDGLRILLKKTIDDLLEGITQYIYQDQGLFTGQDGLAAIILYPQRTFELLGIIGIRAWLAIQENDQPAFNQSVGYIENIIRRNPSAAHPTWERFQEDILITGFILWKAGKTQLAAAWIQTMADWVANLFVERGGIARPTASPREVFQQLLGIHLSFSEVQPVNTSYLCCSIIDMCYWFDLSDVYISFIEKVKYTRLIEFHYEEEDTVFKKELTGTRYQIIPPANWNAFQQWYLDRYFPTDPAVFEGGLSPALCGNSWVLLVVSSAVSGQRG